MTKLLGILLLCSVFSSANASLTLMNAGDEVLDTNTNIIWMQDFTTANGRAGSWTSASNWAGSLTYAGNSTWQLSSKSEWEALTSAYGDLGPLLEFTNVGAGYYWTRGTRGYSTWKMRADGVSSLGDVRGFGNFVAVRSLTASDAATVSATVPVSATIWLFGFGLGLVGFVRKGRA
ncbi:DUF1566 domain-containing protein [Neptunomonas antarctica]|uniref:PEP-CTERM protein-sorting domain-containing protein n=1 Tax=Neptunomonas antarctica TaxID=619304 RepID=A0A1N7N4B9_9GAMM|nr:DUF1566 domain-containing protein [Neptunomonas antarctica]SIS93180.1 PEP-CTERM protein-sorting domain-containing protein [Neptunomonas antarctica]